MKVKFLDNSFKRAYTTGLRDGQILHETMLENDAGLDLRWMLNTMKVQPGQRIKVPTGLAIALPKNYVGLLKDRSGIASSTNIVVHAGVIDPSYRGEISVIIQNHGPEPVDFTYGDRFCQLVVVKRYTGKVKVVEELNKTKRGSKGFGSSGKE